MNRQKCYLHFLNKRKKRNVRAILRTQPFVKSCRILLRNRIRFKACDRESFNLHRGDFKLTYGSNKREPRVSSYVKSAKMKKRNAAACNE